MEDTIPIFGSFFLPHLTYLILDKQPSIEPRQRIKNPIVFYLLFLGLIGMITYLLNMRRHCEVRYYRRTIKKTLLYLTLTLLLFMMITYVGRPTAYWLDLRPNQWELNVTGFILMLCSIFSFYVIKILTSNC